ncbi:MAG: site-specific DNA-methyltransferase, partial [Candidatus Atribacteria bacterium]|nr:site-specific DNA-methyltransferase [Candidatus Atribacteria bacterium]
THKDGVNWSNRMILGDSLLVMASLSEKEGLKGKVQMIYLDPPYGIKFGSNWQVSTRKRDVKDTKAEDVTRQPEQIKAFRDTWEMGIHSYLSYLRDRLVVARDLLTETGSIFVQIGDENVHLVRCLLDEVFGSENACTLIAFSKTSSATSTLLSSTHDYLIWYAKDITRIKYRQLHSDKVVGGEGGSAYTKVELSDGFRRALTSEEKADPSSIPERSRIYRIDNLTSQRPAQEGDVRSYKFQEIDYTPGKGTFKTDLQGLDKLAAARRLDTTSGGLYYVRYYNDFPVFPISNLWDDTGIAGFASDKVYVVQTNVKVLARCILMTTDPGDLVLDPTCGSGTTAYVAEQWGRRWITIDTSRVAIAIARTRLMSARYPFYILADSQAGIEKEAELTGSILSTVRTEDDIRKGFVYKRVPHVTLKSIANNPDIKEGMSREEIDAAIARYTETEQLHDQPYEDGKRIRVCGPFTIESLSPHRVLVPEDGKGRSRTADIESSGTQQFETMILGNLKKAGIQNTIRKERLMFERLEPFAAVGINAVGEYQEDGTTKRAAICIGPEHGTVGPDLVKEAAKEAVKGVGFDMLVVCGFAFDPHVSEETKQYGKLTVLLSRMNPDLSIGDSLLKKTGAGNLFMVFGEPDIAIKKSKDGKIVVDIKGLDIYDPTTGEIRSHSTDQIACWFIDTDYNEESFFVRHAYFCGADQPYEKLKRALKADVSESAWESLYSTKSRPFPAPEKGKIAVKVINHYGDEVLKVYGVPDEE